MIPHSVSPVSVSRSSFAPTSRVFFVCARREPRFTRIVRRCSWAPSYSVRRFTIEAGSGYLRDEFEPFERELLRLNRANVHRRVTVYDLLMDTPNLRTVVESGAKGTREHLDVLIKKLRDRESTLRDAEPDMIALMSKYLTSSQELSRDGRNQFAALYAGVDLVLLNGKLYLNKVYVADYTTFSSIGSLLWNEASLELFTEDLMGNLDDDDGDGDAD